MIRSPLTRPVPVGVALFTVAVLSLATTARAQRSPLSITVRGAGGSMVGVPPLDTKAVKLESYDPARRLLDKKKDLKLDEGQQQKLSSMVALVKFVRDSINTRIDSLQKVRAEFSRAEAIASSARGADREAPKAEGMKVDAQIMAALVDMRNAYRSVGDAAVAVLTPAQKDKGAALILKADDDLAKDVATKVDRRR